MLYFYKGYIIEYEYIHNNQQDTILFLHGWGGDLHSFDIYKTALKNYNHISISLPPYKNYNSTAPLTMYDYRDIVTNILLLHDCKIVTIFCHSFGNRILLLLPSIITIKKCIIFGGAGIQPKRKFIKKIKLQKLQMQSNFSGSPDYRILSPIDKQTFKNIVNLDLSSCIKRIDCPTLLLWGKGDNETPIYMAQKFHKNIANSSLIVTDSNHFAMYEKFQYFIFKIKNFLGAI